MNSPTDNREVQAEDLIEWYYSQGYSWLAFLISPIHPAETRSLV